MKPTEPHPDPLDPNERELARVVRALPGGEPPAMLDARILKASQDAVAASSSRRRKPRWLLGGGAAWGIGSAAAAVLAIGVGWQVMYPTPSTQLPMPARAPAPSSAAADDSTGTMVEFREQAPQRYENLPPPPAAMPAPPVARAVAPRPATPPPPPAAPTPAPAQPAIAAQASGAVAAIETDSTESTSDVMAEKMAKNSRDQAASGIVAEQEAAASARETSNTRQRAQAQAAMADSAAAAPAANRAAGFAGDLAKAEADFQQRPSTWLAHIRELRDGGDDAGARSNLVDFRKRYPDYRIPSDLTRLVEP